MTKLETLGLVILNYNCHQLTIECVNNILYYYDESITMVIVDNNSSDNSYAILLEYLKKHSNINIIKTSYNGGYSYGNNAGVRYINEKFPDIEYFAVINPDTEILDNKIFQNLMSLLENDKSIAGIAPLMILKDRFIPERLAFKHPEYIYGFISSLVTFKRINPSVYRSFRINIPSMTTYVDVIPGSFFVMKKDAFFKINLLDENMFLYGEENVLGKLIKHENLKLGLSMKDYYIHKHVTVQNSLKKDLLFLSHSIKSHLYYNRRFKNSFWCFMDSILIIIFLPLRLIEMILIRFYHSLKKRKI